MFATPGEEPQANARRLSIVAESLLRFEAWLLIQSRSDWATTIALGGLIAPQTPPAFSGPDNHRSGAARAARSAQPPPTRVNENTARVRNQTPNNMGKGSRRNRGDHLALADKVTAMRHYSPERMHLRGKPLSPLRGFRT